MKRRMIALTTAIILTLALTACGETEEKSSSTPTVEQENQTVTEDATDTPEETDGPAETPEVTDEATETPEETDDDYNSSYSTDYVEPNYNPDPVVSDEDKDNSQVAFDAIVAELEMRSDDFKYSKQYIETLDQSKYEVNAENNFDLLFETGRLQGEKEVILDAIFNPVNWSYVEVEMEYTSMGMTDTHWVGITGLPTGEYYLLTRTDTSTGEVIPWGVQVYIEDVWAQTTYVVEDTVDMFMLKHVLDKTETPAADSEADPYFELFKRWNASSKDEVMPTNNTYEGYVAAIEKMDESRYVVTAVEGLEPVLKAELTDTERQAAVDTFVSVFDNYYVEEPDPMFGGTYMASYDATPTGEMYTMTLTDTVTGETIVWGFKVTVEALDKPGTFYVHKKSVNFITDTQSAWGGLGSEYVKDNFAEEYQFCCDAEW